MCITATHREHRQPPLRRGQIRERFLEPAAAMGMTRVVFTGGEPTLRKDLPDILRDAIACGLSITLATNLWHTPAAMLREIVFILIDAESLIQFSFDSIIPEEMNAIRGGRVFERVAANVRSLFSLRTELKSKVRIQSSTTLQVENANSLLDTLHFLLETIGVDRAVCCFRHEFSDITRENYLDQQAPSYSRAVENRRSLLALTFQLHRWAAIDARLLLPGRFRDWTTFLIDPQRIDRSCRAGHFLFVDAYGRLRPCVVGKVYADALANDLAVICASPDHRAARQLLDGCRICLHGCS